MTSGHPELKKMSTQDTVEYPSSSLSVKRRLSPSKSPSVVSISRNNSANNFPLMKMNSKDSLDSNTPSRKPKKRLRSHSSGDLDEELFQKPPSGLDIKRSTSLEPAFDDRKFSPRSDIDRQNTFEPLFDLMAHESLKKNNDKKKMRKKGGRSKSRSRKKRTKKKSRRKKRN